jgi:phage protein D/phage baseplate assembly protein gpV
MPNPTYTAEPLLQVDGQSAPQSLMDDILHISVEESLHLPGMFTLTFRNSKAPGQQEAEFWEHEHLFQIGKTVKIGFKSGTTQSTEFEHEVKDYILEGEITGMETHFTSGSQAPIIIRGYDVSHRLHRGRHNRSFQNMTDSDVVKKIVNEMGIPIATVDSSGAPHDYIFQENQTNMEFLRERAARNGFELFVQNGKLHFRKPKLDDELELQWLKQVTEFQVRVTSAEQVKRVEVRGWDYQQKRPFVATKSSDQVLTTTDHGNGTKTSTAFQGKPSDPTFIVVDQPMFTSQEAETIAQALFNELVGEFVQADAKAEGNPAIRPGKGVKLTKMGKYSGKYYVTEARHIYSERHYTTEFSIRGLRGGDLVTAIAPLQRTRAGQTLMVGIVTDNKDPRGWGRVRVKCPTLTEDHESNWARVVGIGAGKDRGFDCLPEIDDEVLVAFEHGDIHRPYVIGGVWNGSDAPPEAIADTVAGGHVRLRTFKTRTGHTLQFVEEDKGGSKAGVKIKTVYGHEIYLNDSDKVIEVKTNGGQTLKLDDQSNKIEMKATQTISLEAPQTITLKVGSSKVELTQMGVEIQGTQAKMNGTAQAAVEGAIVNVKASGVAAIQGSLLKLN